MAIDWLITQHTKCIIKNSIEIAQRKAVYAGNLMHSECSPEMRHTVYRYQISYVQFPDPGVPISRFLSLKYKCCLGGRALTASVGRRGNVSTYTCLLEYRKTLLLLRASPCASGEAIKPNHWPLLEWLMCQFYLYENRIRGRKMPMASILWNSVYAENIHRRPGSMVYDLFFSIFRNMYALDNECCPFVLGIPLCITHGSPGMASHEQLQFCIQMLGLL